MSISRLVSSLFLLTSFSFFFFFNDTATTEIYTLSLHDALPISSTLRASAGARRSRRDPGGCGPPRTDRKSTRLNSSHLGISYAVFCLKKKKKKEKKNKEKTKHNDTVYIHRENNIHKDRNRNT